MKALGVVMIVAGVVAGVSLVVVYRRRRMMNLNVAAAQAPVAMGPAVAARTGGGHF